MPQAQILALVIPVVMGTTGLLKPFLEQSIIPTTSPLHDPTLRLLVVLQAIIGALVVYIVQTPSTNSVGIWSTIAAGLVAGLGSIGLYGAATGQFTRLPASDGLPPGQKNVVAGQ